ncbi:MAG: CDP-alcohol phosphatidyltransferase family protein, partial [Sphingomonadaceae bacterium]
MQPPAKPLTAVLSIGEALAGNRRPGLAIVAGRTLVERQARQALRAGASALLVLAPALPSDVAARLLRLGNVRLVALTPALADALEAVAGTLLLFEPGVVLDERIVEAVARSPAPAAAVFRATPPATAERVGAGHHWASVASMPAAGAAAALRAHPEWEPVGTLNRTALAMGAHLLEVESLATYSEGRRRDVPLLWQRLVTDADSRSAEAAILSAAQKGCLDWPARFLHPPVENALVRLLWPTAITPNMVTLATAALGLVALFLFAAGMLWPALLLVLMVGPLDGVDGKLARTRIEFSRWGDLEHVMDKILEYGWFLA